MTQDCLIEKLKIMASTQQSCYTCTELPQQKRNDNCDELIGNCTELIYLDCDANLTNPNSESEVQALLTAGLATHYKDIGMTIDAPSPITQTSLIPGRPDRVTKYTRTATYTDGNVNTDNVEGYNDMNASNGTVLGGVIAYYEDTCQIKYWAKPTTLIGGIDDVVNEQSKWTGTLNWESKHDPVLLDWTGGIFGQ